MASFASASIEMKLKDLSCPFTWNMKDAVKMHKEGRLQHNVEIDDVSKDCEISLERLLLLLLLCYKNTMEKDMNAAELKLQEADECFNKIKEQKPKEVDGILIKAIQHVFGATKCHFFYEKGFIIITEDILKSIVHTSDMTDKESGALSGCKSIAWSCLQKFGFGEAIEYATIAVDKNPENALWHFVLGKNLRGKRLCTSIFISTVPDETEKKSFVKAYEIAKNSVYGNYLAQMYREMSYKNDITISERNDLLAKSLHICNEIFEMENLNAFILLKQALDSIDRQIYRQETRKCLDILKKKCPQDPAYLHYRALYMQRLDPYNKAGILQFFKAAADSYNLNAEIEYSKALCTYCTHTDAIQYLEKMSIKYQNSPVYDIQQITLAFAICYYFAKDYKTAAENYLKAIEFAPKSPILNESYKYAMFNKSKSIYYFLKYEFLPMLRQECDFDRDDNIAKTYSKLKNLIPKNVTLD